MYVTKTQHIVFASYNNKKIFDLFTDRSFMMTLNERIIDFLKNEKIEFAKAIKYSQCIERKGYLLKFSPKCAIIFLIPYNCKDSGDRNISRYAVPRDYHLFVKGLFDRLQSEFSDCGYNIACFADHSPIDERDAAAMSGLGAIGDNGLIINEKYGSYVFIGEIVTDCDCDDIDTVRSECMHCGLCKKSCPITNGCLSAITQKKGELSDDEICMMVDNRTIWVCDICQDVCPLNRDVAESPIDFFINDRISWLTKDIIDSMSDDEFSSRAYSWRGRDVILRNIRSTEGQMK